MASPRKSHPPRKRRGWRAFFALGGTALLYFVYLLGTLPDVKMLADHNPESTAFIRAYQEEQVAAGRSPSVKAYWRTLPEISHHLKNAVILGEDGSFFKHNGIDLAEIKAAVEATVKHKKRLRGASTITQQLAKNLYLSPSRNPLRKLREFLIARRLEIHLTKLRILELYLNAIEWGDGIYGAEAASLFYFKKSAAALSQSEAVFLAAIIPNPQYLAAKSRARARREARIARSLSRIRPYF